MGRQERILVLLDDAGPGDAMRSRFALDALRAAHPTAFITLIVSQAAAGVFADGGPHDRLLVSRLYGAGIAGPWRRRVRKLGEAIRLLSTAGLGHDLVLVLNWGTLTLDLLARAAGRRVVGYENRYRSLLTSRLGAYDVEGDPVIQNRTLLAAAGIADAIPPGVPPFKRRRSGDSISRPYAVLHTGTDWACQQWSQNSWAELADRLIAGRGLNVIFTGLQDEAGYIEGIRSMMHGHSTSVAGQTSVAGLRDLLAGAELCVLVDSAPYELAQLTETRTVVLAGPTTGRPLIRPESGPMVVNRTPPSIGLEIRRCQRSHAEGRCHDYSCPLSQLRRIDVDHVMQEVAKLGISTPAGEVAALG